MKNIKDKLLKVIKNIGYMKTSDVIRWGIENHSNTASRKARLLCEEGKIERMDKDTKLWMFGKTKESVWIFKGHYLTISKPTILEPIEFEKLPLL